MFSTMFRRRVKPLDSSTIAFLRVWLRASTRVPAPPYVGAVSPSPEQSLLLLSLIYGAGVKPGELAQMRIDTLFDESGAPAPSVHIRPETTKHFVSRTVPMHPDIRLDALAFRKRHPNEHFVAFVPSDSGSPSRTMNEHGLTEWFRDLFRTAGLHGLTVRSGAKSFNDNQRSN